MEAVSDALSRLLRGLGLERQLLGWRAIQEWPGWVGPRIAGHSRAVDFRDGTLFVEVEGSAWMHELGFLKREIVRVVNQQLGAECVKDVRLMIPRGRSLR